MFPDIDMAALAAQCRAKFFALAPQAEMVITGDRRHIGYLTGYHSILHDGTAPYPQAAIATRDVVALVTGASDGPAALEVMGDASAIWRYGRFFVGARADAIGCEAMPLAVDSFEAAVLNAITALRGTRKAIAVDALSPRLEAELAASVPEASFFDARQDFVLARAVKLPGELELLRHAARITDAAIAGAIAGIAPGMTEFDIAAAIHGHIIRNGGVPRASTVASGERASRVDTYPGPRVIRAGDIVRLDIGCTVNGYWADMARTIVVGEATVEQAGWYQALLAGEQAQLGVIRPGMRARDLFEIAVDTVRRSDALPNYQRTHCGHGIGLSGHEFPTLNADNDAVIEAGMVLCVETPYYEIGWGGMMVEDTAIVTPTGMELLTTSSRDLLPSHLNR